MKSLNEYINEFLVKGHVSSYEANSEMNVVDFNLPSKTLWADRNIGAISPKENGDYFMFGSTEPDTDKLCD